ncbi:MAG: hypothetical protein IJE26_03000 [Oscillospiraceae bacterium]|nr:hypothetical protein [Oscillospiraceae bacterium]MBQ2895659.1 hypothetical protein [Oscillospiraceae bacterium]MBQ3532453.1 hypothetical protein [Oscillospiraceae bacterium]
MQDFMLLLYNAAIALFSFFVVAPIVLNAISLFGVQKRFAKAMVDEGIIQQAEIDRLHPKKQLAGLIISLIVVAVLTFFCIRMRPWGFACGVIPLIAGLLKYRDILGFNSLTVKRFRNSYQDHLDAKKFNKYIEKHF